MLIYYGMPLNEVGKVCPIGGITAVGEIYVIGGTSHVCYYSKVCRAAR